MEIQVLGTLIMAGATFLMAVATFVMAYRVKKAGKEDMEAHKRDRELDARMHTLEHIVSLAHLEAEHLGGLKGDTQKALDEVKEEALKRLKG